MDGNFTTIRDMLNSLEAWYSAYFNADGSLKNAIMLRGTSSAGTDDYVTALLPATLTLTDLIGIPILFHADAAIVDAAATFKVNALAATPITKQGAVAVVADDMVAGGYYVLIYDGTNFQLAVK
jgi:hypothetical protein